MTEVPHNILKKLADDRWRTLRIAHNKTFGILGPGPAFDQFKIDYAGEYREIAALRAYLELPAEE